MSAITFNYPIAPKSIGGFEIDAFLKEHYSYANSVTDIPVEDGSNIADHAVEEALEIQISGFIGKAEFTIWEGPLPKSQSDIQVKDPKTRIRAAYQELLRLKSARQPVDLVTGLDTYHNMVIIGFEIDRDAETGADLPFEMSLKQVKIVKSETTTVNASAPWADQTAPVANMGVAGTQRVDPQSNRMKEDWRAMYQNSGGSLPTRDEFFEKWKEYP
jgi:hypothetical protein